MKTRPPPHKKELIAKNNMGAKARRLPLTVRGGVHSVSPGVGGQ